MYFPVFFGILYDAVPLIYPSELSNLVLLFEICPHSQNTIYATHRQRQSGTIFNVADCRPRPLILYCVKNGGLLLMP